MTYAPQKRQKRYVVAAKGLSPHAETALSNHLTTAGCGWWHWIPGVWLIVDPEQRWTTESLRDLVLGFIPGGNVVALELQDAGNWSSSSPKEGLEWMYDTWT